MNLESSFSLLRVISSVATAGFFPLDLGFSGSSHSSGFLGIFVSNLGFFIYYLS